MDEFVVRGMMAATLRVLRMFGLAPLRFSRIDSGVYLVSPSRIILIIGVIYLFGLQSTMVLVYYFYIMDIIKKFLQMRWFSMTYIVLQFLNIIWTSIFLTIAVVGGAKRMNNLLILLKKIQEVQTKLGYNTSVEPKLSTVLIILLSSVIINFFVHALYIYLLFYYSNREVLLYMSNVSALQMSFVILLELQYIFLVINLYLVVKTINDQMSQIIVKSKGLETTTDDLTYKKLKSLCQCYIEICSAVRQMNQSEGLMIISLISRETIHMFITSYLLSVVARKASSHMRNFQMLAYTMMLLHTSSRTVIFSEIGFRLQCEVNKYKTLLTEMMSRQCDNVTLQRKLDNNVYHILLKQPALSPLEIITFGRPLIATIVGANISFMIIIFQFKLDYV